MHSIPNSGLDPCYGTTINFPATIVDDPGVGPVAPNVITKATTQQTVYDGQGHRVQETDQAGVRTQFFYDRLGNLTIVTNAFGTTEQAITSYKYDSFGNLIEQTDARRNTRLARRRSSIMTRSTGRRIASSLATRITHRLSIRPMTLCKWLVRTVSAEVSPRG